jgi:hypothetical protein
MREQFARDIVVAGMEIAARKDEEELSLLSSQNEEKSSLMESELLVEQGLIDDAESNGRLSSEQAAERKLSLEKKYNSLKEASDRELKQKEDEIKKKAFDRNKAMSLVDIAISTARGISSVSPVIPLMVLAGATGAIQAGIVASQKFKAARGGIVPGVPSGVDQVDALLAPGEAVINSRSAAMFGPELSAINQLGGGISLGAPTNITGTQRNNNIYEGGQQTIKAYVTESDITTNQKRVSRYKDNAEY